MSSVAPIILPCNVGTCTGVAVTQCSVCEYNACAAHGLACGDCGCDTCHDCVRIFPLDDVYYCLNCHDKLAGSSEEVVSSCPLILAKPLSKPAAFDQFDPPIVTMTYAESKQARKQGICPDNVHAEHIVPNSCFMVGSGRTGATIVGA